MIQFQVAPCVVSVLAEKVLGNMRRQQIEKDSPVAVLQGVHLLFLLFGLALPQKVQLQDKELPKLLSAFRWYYTTTKKQFQQK
jgi:hypothetical protein